MCSDMGLLGTGAQRVGDLRRNAGSARLVIIAQVRHRVLVGCLQEDVHVEIHRIVAKRIGEVTRGAQVLNVFRSSPFFYDACLARDAGAAEPMPSSRAHARR